MLEALPVRGDAQIHGAKALTCLFALLLVVIALLGCCDGVAGGQLGQLLVLRRQQFALSSKLLRVLLDRLLSCVALALENVRLLAQPRGLGLRCLERGEIQIGAQVLRLLLGKLLRLRLASQSLLGLARLLRCLLRGFFRGLLAALRGGECGDSALGVVQLGSCCAFSNAHWASSTETTARRSLRARASALADA